jgi:topoisomerase-4 subunit A
LKPAGGASFVQVLMGQDRDKLIMASSQGYGFINTLDALDTNQKAGKAVINFDDNATLMTTRISEQDTLFGVISSAGYLLVYPLTELPEMKRGKGNKLIDLKDGETVINMVTFAEGDSLSITAGKRTLTLKPADIANFKGTRGRRGSVLPKGFQKVSSIEKAV